MNSIELSVVSPVYQAELCLENLVKRIRCALENITDNYEIILVDDCSTDGSWNIIKNICENDIRVKGICFSRNFGQHYAITAGLSSTKGKWVVVMDCDLQDRPEEIPRLYKKALEGYDTVFAQRVDRQDLWLKRFSSRLFYKLFSYLTNTKQDCSVANFGIYHRKVVLAILTMKDHIRFFPVMSQWVGFRQTFVPVEHNKRKNGKTGYGFLKLMRLAGNNMIGFSNKPLKLMLTAGFIITVMSLIVAVCYFVRWTLGFMKVDGFTTLVISIWFSLGVLSIMIGMVGVYIGQIFDHVKDRPYYIISETANL